VPTDFRKEEGFDESGHGGKRMKQKGKRTLTPKLRFPEFRDAPGWEGIPIGGKVDLLSGYPFDGKDISEDNSGTQLLRGVNITEGMIRHSTDIDRYFLGNTVNLEKFELKVGDLVIGMDGSKVGKNSAMISATDAGSLLIQRVARLRHNDKTLTKFIFLHINSSKFHRYVDKINTSSGIPHISAKQIQDFIIYFPSRPEQQKIADCLGSLDSLISVEGRKLAALRDHKRGLMQQLFPQPGQTQPRLRFPEFRGKGEWGEAKLQDISAIKTGPFGSTLHQSDYAKTGTPIVTVEHLSDQGLIHTNLPLVSDDDKNRLNSYFLLAGDIVFSRVGSVDRNSLVKEHEEGWLFSGRLLRIRTQESIVNPTYLSYFFQLESTKEMIRSVAVGQTMASLNTEILNKFTVLITDLEEQQRIASCLSSVDTLITAQAAKIDALKQHKRGLIQQLLPTPEGNE
jgi:type I restriction enzyme, S subunit